MILINKLSKIALASIILLALASIMFVSLGQKSTADTYTLISSYSGINGNPLGGVKIELIGKNQRYSFMTPSNGILKTTIFPGRYKLSATKLGYIATDDSVTVGGMTNLKVKLFPKQKGVVTFNNNYDTDASKSTDSTYIYKLGDEAKVAGDFSAPIEGEMLKKTEMGSEATEKDYRKDKVARKAMTLMALPSTSSSFKTGEPGKYISEFAIEIPNAKAGLLTAGEVNDYSKWNLWNDITAGDLKKHTTTWNILPQNRYTVQVSNENNFPIVNAEVKLVDKKGSIIWTATSDQTGKAELWADLYDIPTSMNNTDYDIIVTMNDQMKKVKNAKPFKSGINFIKIKHECSKADTVDIAWVVDATGSMGDEIAYLKEELNDVMEKAKSKHPDLNFRLGSVFYRDHGDAYLTTHSDLNSDIHQTINFIKNQSAGGGGDFPEAVDTALSVAMHQLHWSKNSRTKLLFLVLDAPPHADLASIARVKKAIQYAAKFGIRIIPVASSGIDKSTEYLLRCLALATNGTYTFLTDDSGIGGAHIKPTTDEYKVETLNGLLLRLIDQYTLMVSCDKQLPDTFKYIKDTLMVQNRFLPKDTSGNDTTQYTQNPKPKDSSENQPHLQFAKWKYYPNPTTGPLTVEVEGQINELFLTDFSGKILMRFQPGNESVFTLNLEQYPSGVYFLRYYYNDKMLDGRVVLLH